MSTLATFTLGAFFCGLLLVGYIACYYLRAPSEVLGALFVAFVGVLTPLVGFVVNVLKANPIIGQASAKRAMQGNGAITSDPGNRTEP